MVEEFRLSDPQIPKADPKLPPSPNPDPPQPSVWKPGAHDTPMVSKQSASACFTSTPDERDPRLILMGDEIMNKIIGPMPVQEFLDEFLPVSNAKLPSLRTYQTEITKVSNSKDEREMYKPFVKAIQSLCRNFSVVATQDHPFIVFHKVSIKPDICLYPKNDTGHISEVELMIEAKYPKTSDPFSDTPGKPLINTSDATRETLGQITSYASAHQASQFRSYAFSLLLFPTYARILRWDRSGVIVTNRIPLTSTDLPEFFHRFDRMTAEQRGFDPTVTKPSSSNELRARQLFGFNDDVCLIQLSVGDSGYIVPRDTYTGGTRSPLGRSTRPFYAYSLSLKKMVFLKDTWRLQSQTAEHELYAKLKEKKVPHIATVLAGGDVLDQQTLTQDFVEKDLSWVKDRPKRLRKHFHYRLVLEEIGTPLTTFTSTKLLIKVMHDALIAHKMAYEEANILHRDISPNNILIYNGSALLIDWDLSKDQENIQQAREAERTGTWQFTAARLLNPEAAGPQTLTDDVESFVYVLTWTAFRYADHKMTQMELTDFLRSVFDHSFTDENGCRRDGGAKSKFLKEPAEIENAGFQSKHLKHLLLFLTDIAATRYRKPPSAIAQQWNNNLAEFQLDGESSDDDGTKTQRKYEKRLKELKSSKWIIKAFAVALKRDNWPENDAAQEHELYNIPSVLKTSAQDPSLQVKFVKNDRDEGEEESESSRPPAKKARLNRR